MCCCGVVGGREGRNNFYILMSFRKNGAHTWLAVRNRSSTLALFNLIHWFSFWHTLCLCLTHPRPLPQSLLTHTPPLFHSSSNIVLCWCVWGFSLLNCVLIHLSDSLWITLNQNSVTDPWSSDLVSGSKMLTCKRWKVDITTMFNILPPTNQDKEVGLLAC